MSAPRASIPVPAPTARGAVSRARLIAAARDELIERDGQLEVDSVAARAESSVGPIHRHFGSRAGLVGAVVDDFTAEKLWVLIAGVAGVDPGDPEP